VVPIGISVALADHMRTIFFLSSGSLCFDWGTKAQSDRKEGHGLGGWAELFRSLGLAGVLIAGHAIN